MTRLTRWSIILLVTGCLSILAASWLNRPSVWRPLVIESSEAGSETTGVRLRSGTDYEVSLEVERQQVAAAVRELVTPEPQSAVVGHWAITCQGNRIAAGDLANYIRIETVASWRGELYRLVARVPFGVDEANYRTLGLTGRYLSERVVGAFRLPDDVAGPCDFSRTIERSANSVRVAVRRSEDDWREHNRQLAFLPVGGVLAVFLGSLALLVRGSIVLRSRRDDPHSRQP